MIEEMRELSGAQLLQVAGGGCSLSNFVPDGIFSTTGYRVMTCSSSGSTAAWINPTDNPYGP